MAREKNPTSFYVSDEDRIVANILRLGEGLSFSAYASKAFKFYNQHLLNEHYGGITPQQMVEKTLPFASPTSEAA